MKKLIYKIECKTNTGIEEEPIVTSEIFGACQYADDETFDEVYANVAVVAYNGEITVEEVDDSETAPTQLDQIEAQVTYTAMMTDTLLEV